jgi:hypothetical protein
MIISQSIEPVLGPGTTVEYFCNSIRDQRPSRVFLTALWETFSLDIPDLRQVVQPIDQFMTQHGIPCTWIVTKWAEPENNWQQLSCPVIFFDFFLWRSFNEIVNKNKSKVNQTWNTNATRCLFLTGKPNRLNRAGLLGLLQHNRLLENCDWSFFVNPGMKESSKLFFSKFCNEDFDHVVTQHIQSPDNVMPKMQPHSLHYGGIPYNEQMFLNARVRLISETSTSEVRPWITEKTWITILNRNPFVIAGDSFSCQHLRNLGFVTFDHMFDIPSYDDVIDEVDRMHAVVEHVRQWIDGNYSQQYVADAVEHNHDHLVKTAHTIKQTFEDQIGCDINNVIYTVDHSI